MSPRLNPNPCVSSTKQKSGSDNGRTIRKVGLLNTWPFFRKWLRKSKSSVFLCEGVSVETNLQGAGIEEVNTRLLVSSSKLCARLLLARKNFVSISSLLFCRPSTLSSNETRKTSTGPNFDFRNIRYRFLGCSVPFSGSGTSRVVPWGARTATSVFAEKQGKTLISSSAI